MILGVAAAGVGASVVAEAKPASATDGNPVLIGKANKAKATTSVTTTVGNGLEGTTSDDNDTSSGVYGYATGEYGSGVNGYATGEEGYGVYGLAASFIGVYGESGGEVGYGVNGFATGEDGYGVYGQSIGDAGIGVYGISTYGLGVSGYSEADYGVCGLTLGNGAGGVEGVDHSPGGGYGVYASSAYGTALWADGDAIVTGKLSKGGGSFKIDHPVDPAAKYLYHSFVESPDMKNVYDGTVILDSKGQATVELPDWFEALNRDYRYQLTAIGSSAPELHVSRKVEDGKFSIAGGKARQEVSWQVTGIRQDAWANANRIPVEVDKKAEDQGRYLHPELFGGEAITSIARARKHTRRTKHATRT
jgi:hypothetical protein